MTVRLLHGDCRDVLKTLPDASVHCCVTSPPYFGLRDYGMAEQIGLESTPDAYIAELVAVFREVRRVLRDDGVLFLNIGDSYHSGNGATTGGCSPKSTLGGGGGRYREGSKAEAMFNQSARGEDAQEYDTAGKAGSGSLGRGSSSRNRGGERTGVWWSHIADTDAGRALVLVAEPLTQIRACMEELLDRLPNADCALLLPSEQSSAAILDQAQSAILAAERLLASLPSIPAGCVPPLLASSRLSDSASACVWSLRSFVACVRRCAHMLDAPSETIARTADIASLCEELEQHIRCTSACCSTVSSWVEFKPERSTSQLKAKDLIGIPWRVAFALQADGWWLRQDIIWHKPNPMPESVTDRCTKAHEYVFMLSKSAQYFYDQDAIKEPSIYASLAGQDESGFKDARLFAGKNSTDKKRGHSRRHAGFNARWDAMTKEQQCSGMRNKRSVWTIATKPYSEAHFATMAPQLAETCILAGCPEGGTVLDPFGGAGTTGLAAERLHCNSIMIELNQAYRELAERRITGDAPLFTQIEVEA